MTIEGIRAIDLESLNYNDSEKSTQKTHIREVHISE